MTLPTSIIAKPNVRITHHRIHEGNFFSTHTVSTGLMVANPKLFHVDTSPIAPAPPETIEEHMIFIVSANPGIKIEFFENAIVANDGTPIPTINQNRNSTTLPVGNIFEDPIITSEGTLLFSQIVGSATTGGTGGLLQRDEQEFELQVSPGTFIGYLLKITPLANNTDITVHFKLYDARPSSPIPIP